MYLKHPIAGLIVVALAGVLAWSSASHAAEPSSAPFFRIETGMHTAHFQRIAVDYGERFLVTDRTTRPPGFGNFPQVSCSRSFARLRAKAMKARSTL